MGDPDLGWEDGDPDAGGEAVLLRVVDVALALEDALSKDYDGPDDGVVGGGQGDLYVWLCGGGEVALEVMPQ